MTSGFSDLDPEDKKPGTRAPAVCKRPGCGKPLPAAGLGRGRTRQFCSNECARRYHNDARISAPRSATAGTDDPLAALESAIRHVAVLVRAARDQAASLDAAQVRARLAEAEAARRRAEEALAAAQEAARAARAEADRCIRERDDAVARAQRAETELRVAAARSQLPGRDRTPARGKLDD